MTRAIELRVWKSGPSNKCQRAKPGDTSAPIQGLASVFYRDGQPETEYWLYYDVVEHIMPGAFDRAMKEAQDVRGLFNHDPSQLLGRTSAGTLALSITDVGLAYEIPFAPTDPDHQRVASKLDRGDVTGSSFAFVATRTSWIEQKTADGNWIYIRQVEDLDLYDVGPVTFPAYTGATSGRSALQKPREGDFKRSAMEELRTLIAERDEYLGNDVAVRLARLRAA
jgi:uncharacterized protein